MTYFFLRRSDDPDGAHALMKNGAYIPAGDVAALRRSVDLLKAVDKARLESRSEARRIEEAAYADGYAEGERAAAAAMVEAVARVEADYAVHCASARDGAARLAVEIVRKLLGDMASDEKIAALAAKAAQEVGAEDAVTVRVAPANVKVTTRRLSALPVAVTVEADASLSKEDCVLETPRTIVDASLEAQLTALTSAFEKSAPDHDSGAKQ
ncbi:MAG: FliH/SctL family protein [Pseudomonadota bacterium]